MALWDKPENVGNAYLHGTNDEGVTVAVYDDGVLYTDFAFWPHLTKNPKSVVGVVPGDCKRKQNNRYHHLMFVINGDGGEMEDGNICLASIPSNTSVSTSVWAES